MPRDTKKMAKKYANNIWNGNIAMDELFNSIVIYLEVTCLFFSAPHPNVLFRCMNSTNSTKERYEPRLSIPKWGRCGLAGDFRVMC